jgi:hypothetical protein
MISELHDLSKIWTVARTPLKSFRSRCLALVEIAPNTHRTHPSNYRLAPHWTAARGHPLQYLAKSIYLYGMNENPWLTK